MDTARHPENEPQKESIPKDAPVTPAEETPEASIQNASVDPPAPDAATALDPPLQKGPDPFSREMPHWAKAMQEKIEALEAGRKAESSRATAQALLSKSSLPDVLKEKWLGRIRFEGERPAQDQVKALEEEYAEIERSLLRKNSALGLPVGGQTHAIGEKEIENIVANL